MSDYGEDYDSDEKWQQSRDPLDYEVFWTTHFYYVLHFALTQFIGNQRRTFDFSRAPYFSDFPPEYTRFHTSFILPIANLIAPDMLEQHCELTKRERFGLIAPLIRNVIAELYNPELEHFVTMREEVHEELRVMLTFQEGMTRDASWNECFYGKQAPEPKTCSQMARRA